MWPLIPPPWLVLLLMTVWVWSDCRIEHGRVAVVNMQKLQSAPSASCLGLLSCSCSELPELPAGLGGCSLGCTTQLTSLTLDSISQQALTASLPAAAAALRHLVRLKQLMVYCGSPYTRYCEKPAVGAAADQASFMAAIGALLRLGNDLSLLLKIPIQDAGRELGAATQLTRMWLQRVRSAITYCLLQL